MDALQENQSSIFAQQRQVLAQSDVWQVASRDDATFKSLLELNGKVKSKEFYQLHFKKSPAIDA